MGISEETKFTIARNTVYIDTIAKNIKPGDYIYANTRTFRVSTVYKSAKRKLGYSINGLILTKDQYIYTDKGKIKASDINIGDMLLNWKNGYEEVSSKKYSLLKPVIIFTANGKYIVNGYVLSSYVRPYWRSRIASKPARFASRKNRYFGYINKPIFKAFVHRR